MYHSKITGLGYYVPDNVVTNDDLSKIMDTNDEWIQERTGIQERRHIIPGKDTTTTMGVKAAQIAIERAGVSKEDIDFVVFAINILEICSFFVVKEFHINTSSLPILV